MSSPAMLYGLASERRSLLQRGASNERGNVVMWFLCSHLIQYISRWYKSRCEYWPVDGPGSSYFLYSDATHVLRCVWNRDQQIREIE